MKIVVCYKSVPEEQDIQVNKDHTLNLEAAPKKIGQYDLNAVQAAIDIKAAVDSQVIALTAAGAVTEDSKLRKAILSRGPAEMYGIRDERLDDADSYALADVIRAGIQKIGAVDLVLCGEGSGDIYSQQVGSVLGALLGWPVVNAVSKITAKEKTLIVERSLEDGIEVLELTLPAVISVTTDINVPRIPGMKDILGAGKKPFTIWSLADIGADLVPGSETISILAPEQTERLQVILEGDSDENIETFYNHLRKVL